MAKPTRHAIRVATSVYLDPSTGRYALRVRSPANGVREHFVWLAVGTSQREAEAKLERIHERIRAGVYVRGEDVRRQAPTVAEVTRMWLDMKECRPSSRRLYETQARQWLDRFGSRPVSELDYRYDVAPFVEDLDAKSAAWRNQSVAALRSVMRLAVSAGYVGRNVVDLVQSKREAKPAPELPSMRDLEPAFAYWRGRDLEAVEQRQAGLRRMVYHGHATFWRLVILAALRFREATNLRTKWIGDRVIRIPAGSAELPIKARYSRTVPIPESMVEALETHMATVEAVGTDEQRAALAAGIVFPSKLGRVPDPQVYRHEWARAISRCGLPWRKSEGGVHPHTFRYIGISRMAQHLPPEVVMRITGHRDLTMHWHYRRSFDGDEGEARRALAELDASGPARGLGTAHLSTIGAGVGNAGETDDDDGDATP